MERAGIFPLGQKLYEAVAGLVRFVLGGDFVNNMKWEILLVQAVAALALVRLVIGSIETTPAAHPWSTHRFTMRRTLGTAFAIVATCGLALAGVRALAERRVPAAFWWALPVFTLAATLIGAAVLRSLRRDISGIPALDALLVGVPLSAAAWLAALGFATNSFTFWQIVCCLILTVGLSVAWNMGG